MLVEFEQSNILYIKQHDCKFHFNNNLFNCASNSNILSFLKRIIMHVHIWYLISSRKEKNFMKQSKQAGWKIHLLICSFTIVRRTFYLLPSTFYRIPVNLVKKHIWKRSINGKSLRNDVRALPVDSILQVKISWMRNLYSVQYVSTSKWFLYIICWQAMSGVVQGKVNLYLSNKDWSTIIIQTLRTCIFAKTWRKVTSIQGSLHVATWGWNMSLENKTGRFPIYSISQLE